MKLRLTDYNDNTHMDSVHDISGWWSDWGHRNVKYNVNVPLFTYWLHDAEFKELDGLAKEARLHGLEANETNPWDTALSWALVDKTA